MNNIHTIDECISANLDAYFRELGDNTAHNVWDMVMHSVERAMLEKVMEYAQGNQSKAAQILGITRNTLRKKLISNHLIDTEAS
ncbi:helix-turn-helix domain-containing protein [Pelistega europaea]|uniref:Putative Fis-like DNA-binding protein n=1 Tax=Pelistega europaea TaxID=106147 RepID=A0A7Y4P5F6_9BURK|nr:helix-turn-helix domain-containing protein [Pelistega europaea]NOL49753.1 Fis family transcriptional regulator [Pelistega europaea]